MPGAVRKGIDSAGGTIVAGSSNVFVNNASEVRVGDSVQPHGSGKHQSPKIAEGSSNVFINNISTARQGDKADCGHTASGSSNVFING